MDVAAVFPGKEAEIPGLSIKEKSMRLYAASETNLGWVGGGVTTRQLRYKQRDQMAPTGPDNMFIEYRML